MLPKLRNLVLSYVWEDPRLWACWNHSFYMHLSYLGPIACVFNILSFLGAHHGRVTTVWWLLHGRFSFLSCGPSGLTSSHRRAAVTDDYDVLVYWYDREYSTSHMAIYFMWNHKKHWFKWGNTDQTLSYKIKFWGSNVKHGDYSYYRILERFWE